MDGRKIKGCSKYKTQNKLNIVSIFILLMEIHSLKNLVFYLETKPNITKLKVLYRPMIN